MRNGELELMRYDFVKEDLLRDIDVVFVNRDDIRGCEKYRIRLQPRYPCYKIGIYSQNYGTFDQRAFATSGRCLLTIDTLIKEYKHEGEYRYDETGSHVRVETIFKYPWDSGFSHRWIRGSVCASY